MATMAETRVVNAAGAAQGIGHARAHTVAVER
jgi:hypothetical protein